MLTRCVLLLGGGFVLTVLVGLWTAHPSEPASADDGETSYRAEPAKPEATPGPHFAYQQAALAQATGLAPLTLPAPPPRLPPGQSFDLGNGVRPTMPTPLPQLRQTVEILRDVLVEARKAGPQLQPTDIKAVVVDGDQAWVVVECNCSPRPLLIARMASDAPVRYLTFRIHRRYPGVNVAAGPETAEIRSLMQRSQGLPPGFR